MAHSSISLTRVARERRCSACPSPSSTATVGPLQRLVYLCWSFSPQGSRLALAATAEGKPASSSSRSRAEARLATCTRTAIHHGESKRCASSRLWRARSSTPRAPLTYDAARLPVSLMALLKAATPAFLTPHRNLTEVPCCVRLFSRSRRYSDAAAGRPQSTSARRRAPHRLSSTARTKSGIWRLLRLKNSTLLPRDHRGAVPDAHGGSWRAHRATTPRRGRTRAAAAARMWAATGACWRQERAAGQRVQQCGWRAWSAQDRGRRPRCGREVARRRDRLSAVFRCPRGARGCDRWGAAAAPGRLQAGRGWPGGCGWLCWGRAKQRGRAPGPALVAAARGLACMRMFCSWRYNRGCISGSGDE